VFLGFATGSSAISYKIFHHPEVEPEITAHPQSTQLTLFDQPVDGTWMDMQVVRNLPQRQ
jgi:hypothetical protein